MNIPSVRNSLLVLFLWSGLFLTSIDGQITESFDVPFIKDGDTLSNANVGGLDMPQFYNVDLDNDGEEELYIYDKSANAHLGFEINTTGATPTYQFNQKLTSSFPSTIRRISILKDYDADGIMDLFTYSDVLGVSGIRVLKGYYDAQGLAFEPIEFQHQQHDLLYYETVDTFAPIFLYNLDHPSITDVDNDGDIDILTFINGGGYIAYFKNQSQELGYGSDSLLFTLEDECWGKFFEDPIAGNYVLSADPLSCASNLWNGSSPDRSPHGGATLLTLDLDEDSDLDALLGDLNFSRISALYNSTGNMEQAYMTEQELGFPTYDAPIAIDFLPAAWQIDIDRDGIKDLLAAPFIGFSENVNVGWYYRNVGSENSPTYEFQQEDFLCDGIVDVGTASYPAFFDYNADGLLDLVITSYNRFIDNTIYRSSLYLFENKGSPDAPVYELIDEDWLGMSAYNAIGSRGFAPAFGDLDNDGDIDLLMGDNRGHLYYAENMAEPDNAASFPIIVPDYMDIDVAQHLGFEVVPMILDYNFDGKKDIVLGERDGVLIGFGNIGTLNVPSFDPLLNAPTNEEYFGQIDISDVGVTRGWPSPVFIPTTDGYDLIIGTEYDGLKHFRFDDQSGIADELNGNMHTTSVQGNYQHPAIADIDNDDFYEIAIGNLRGGIHFYQTEIPVSSEVSIPSHDKESSISIFPSPARSFLTINGLSNKDYLYKILHIDGSLIRTTRAVESKIDVSELHPGMYSIQIIEATSHTTIPFIKQ